MLKINTIKIFLKNFRKSSINFVVKNIRIIFATILPLIPKLASFPLKTDKIRKVAFAAMIDVDRFKTINDSYGHDVGDSVIRIVGSVLKHSTRREDFVIRYGGDEFLIVFTGGNIQTVTERIEMIRQEIKNKVNLPGFEVTLSVGVAPYQEGTTLNETIKKADEALYHSKNSGKDRVTVYGQGPEMNLS